jgi:hypothetical protein
MKLLLSILLFLITFTNAADVEVQDQVFCAMDQLAILVEKQEVLLNEMIKLRKDYNQSSDYFAR